MEIDKTTLNDLNIFNHEEEYSIFKNIDFTKTTNGNEQLKLNLSQPLSTIEQITDVQKTLQSILNVAEKWPLHISNGTIMVVERFYETPITPIPSIITNYNYRFYKLFHNEDCSFVKYSVSHCFDLVKGMMEILNLLKDQPTPTPLKNLLEELVNMFTRDDLQIIGKNVSCKNLNDKETLQLGYFFKYKFKYQMKRLLYLHSTIDAWYGMAMATQHYNLSFPTFMESTQPFIYIKNGYHLILKKPVPYSLTLNKEAHFLFLTGANMAGKSTFIKAVGTAVFLAHIGMGVPAESMELTVFDGMLSNINIMDDLAKGESYFYNEVQRIKASINKINDGKKWLVLIDELFKGTNVEDAMKCSNVVIEGLIKIPNALFILSTHLYEISERLKKQEKVLFKYFETNVSDDSFSFNYQLKEGVSNDRLGYLILKKEGVVSMLEKI